MNITVLESYIDEVSKKLTSLEKKAGKYGVDFSFEFGEVRFEKVAVYIRDHATKTDYLDHHVIVEVRDIEISENIIRSNGWTVLAHIEHGNPINLVTAINSTINHDWFTLTPKCDHCNTKHNRKITYLVQRGDEVKQVGSACLRDYTGIDPQIAISFAALRCFIIDDGKMMDGEFIRDVPQTWSVESVVALAYDDIQQFGYRKDGVTRDAVKKLLKDGAKPSDKALEVARASIEWAENIVPNEKVIPKFHNDYAINASHITRKQYAKGAQLGRLTYLTEAYAAHLKDEERKATREAYASTTKHVGAIGDKIMIDAICSVITSFDGQYGITYVNKMVDNDGNIYIWKTGKSLQGRQAISGTIKEHSDWNGEKQTVLTRCRVK